jgi:hypothetical protein
MDLKPSVCIEFRTTPATLAVLNYSHIKVEKKTYVQKKDLLRLFED